MPDGIYLTFDDGPHSEFTPAVLDQLKRFGAKATFFITGNNLDRHGTSIVERAIAEGHTIGIHGLTHRRPEDIPIATLAEKLQTFQSHLMDLLRTPVLFYRPPYGALSEERASKIFAITGMTVVYWSFDTNDWREEIPVRAIVDNFVNDVRAGDIILMHDGIADARDWAQYRAWRSRRRMVIGRLDEILSVVEQRGLISRTLPRGGIDCPVIRGRHG